jgi:hypothetical protein
VHKSFTSESAEEDMIRCIHSDIFFQEQYVLNEVNTRIKPIKSKDAFCLMAAEQLTILMSKHYFSQYHTIFNLAS